MHRKNLSISPEQLSRSTYGIILFCSILLTVEHLQYGVAEVISTLVISMLLVALAESYAEVLATRARKKALLTRKNKKTIFKNSLAIFIGSEIPIVLFLAAYISLISLQTAFLLSKVLIVLLLFAYSYQTSRLSQKSVMKSFVHAIIGTSIVLVIILLKSLWH